jgi:CubicO group peptidase (beta-lactamase class C family)
MESTRENSIMLKLAIKKRSGFRLSVPFIALFWGVMALNGMSQTPDASQGLVAAIDQLVANLDVVDSEPGVAVLVHKPGVMLFKKGYGLANLKERSPITTRTQFEIASCTKPFTATAVLLLHDRNKLSIDQDVRSILPELPEYSPKRPILIRDLLSHTSGLPEYFDFKVVPEKGKSFVTNIDYLPLYARLKSDHPQQFKAGARFRYCNSNYLLLALIVERVSGMAFGDFMKQEIFGPIGMSDTFLYSSPHVATVNAQSVINRASGYEWSKQETKWSVGYGTPPDFIETEFPVGDGGIWTNLEDFLKWDTAVRARKWLKPETWKLALTPATTRSGKPFEYGLGWEVYSEEPSKVIGFGHDGLWGGFRTNYYYDHETDSTIIFLSNRSDFDCDKVWEELSSTIKRFQDEV